MGQDAFLQLLVTELQHQDPTSAQDPNTMITQMAQFSSLEAQTNTNTLLTSMQGQVSAMYQAQSSSLIGTDVKVTNTSLNLSGGTASIGISMPSAAAKVSLTIQNAAGQTVATLNPGALAAGDQVVTWNGKATNGNQLADGTYTVNIAATDASGNSVAATTTANATVTAVNFVNGTIMVTAGGQQYPLSAISEISS
jgi:flagellar basal-body rod modification protein FlgD